MAELQINGSGVKEPSVSRDFGIIPIPKRLRYDPERPFKFTLTMNIIFGIASTFGVANLAYCQPILIQLAETFNVSYEEVSRIPTLVLAGYGIGLALITPLGDVLKRRSLALILSFTAATLTIGLCLTTSVAAFEILSLFIGIASVTPQILMPLAADLAPPEKRGAAVSVVLSGILLGVLIARVISGVIAQFASWRIVFYVAFGLQYGILLLLWLVLPDYPRRNTGLTYLGILGTMAKLAVTEPVLIQACLINFLGTMMFASFWVTLTFLLSAPPYNYSTLDIGLFGFVGMFGVVMAPVTGRVVDKMVPWMGVFIANFILLVAQSLQTGLGGVNIAGPILVCFFLDLGRQMQMVSLTTKVFSIKPEARSRLNAVLIVSIFLGQVAGTSAGAKVYNEFGWRICSVLSLGYLAAQYVVLFARGPHASDTTWFGWQAGFRPIWRRHLVQPASDAKPKPVDVEAVEERKSEEKNQAIAEGRSSDETNTDVDAIEAVLEMEGASGEHDKQAQEGAIV